VRACASCARKASISGARRAAWVLQARLGGLQALRRLGALRALGLRLEREHRLARGELLAPGHVQLLELAGVGGGEQDELALDVALPGVARGLAASREQQGGEER
jgi:hypothetical protein